jgi:hypothetical protein
MSRTIGWIVVLGCLILPPASSGQPKPGPPALTTEQWRNDLRFFARDLAINL